MNCWSGSVSNFLCLIDIYWLWSRELETFSWFLSKCIHAQFICPALTWFTPLWNWKNGEEEVLFNKNLSFFYHYGLSKLGMPRFLLQSSPAPLLLISSQCPVWGLECRISVSQSTAGESSPGIRILRCCEIQWHLYFIVFSEKNSVLETPLLFSQMQWWWLTDACDGKIQSTFPPQLFQVIIALYILLYQLIDLTTKCHWPFPNSMLKFPLLLTLFFTFSKYCLLLYP